MQQSAARFYDFGRFRVDRARRVLLRDQRPVILSAKVFDLLCFLLCERERAVSRGELFRALWPDVTVEDGNLSVNISILRKALRDEPGSCYIETLPRVGYRFCGQVREHSEEVESAPPAVALDCAEPVSAPGRDVAALAPANTASRAPFVGRDAEMARLEQVTHRWLAGEGRVVFVTGEVGLGKTTLLRAFLERLEAGTRLWSLRGQCVEHYGNTEPYLPLLEALARACRGNDGAQLAGVLRRVAPTWLGQMPSLRDAAAAALAGEQSSAATPLRMTRELADGLEVLAQDRPVVLALEDLHWADYSTLDLIAHLARRYESVRCLIVATHRPGEEGASGEALGKIADRLRSTESFSELSLEHLTESAVQEYLRARFGASSMEVQLAALIHERTRGNPLFVVQLADTLSERTELPPQEGAAELAGRAGAALALPATTAQRIETEVDRLSPFARSVLEAASAAGVEFAVSTVASAIEGDVVEVERLCLSWSRRRRLLVAGDEQEWPDGTRTSTCRFIHALYQQVLYRRLGVARRSQLHQRIGEQLERGFARRTSAVASQLHMHFERGLEPHRAVPYMCQAGETALSRGASREAAELFQKGLSLLCSAADHPDNPRRELDLQLGLAGALNGTQGYGAVELESVHLRALTLARQVGDAAKHCDALFGLGLWSLVRGRIRATHELALQLSSVPQASAAGLSDARAHYLLSAAAFYSGRPQEALEIVQPDLARNIADPHSGSAPLRSRLDAVHSMLGGAHPLSVCGHVDLALEQVERAMTVATDLKDARFLAYALQIGAFVHQLVGDYKSSLSRAEALGELAEKSGLSYSRCVAAVLRGHALVEAGQLQDGLQAIEQGWAGYSARGAQIYGPLWLSALSRALLRLGRIECAAARLQEAWEIAQRNEESIWNSELWRLEGDLRREWRRTGYPPLCWGSLRGRSEEDCYLQALELARAQGARLFELRAAASLDWLSKNDTNEPRIL